MPAAEAQASTDLGRLTDLFFTMRQHWYKRAAVPLLIFWAFAAAVPAPAQQFTLQLDPARTDIAFTLPATLHTVHGTFRLKSGAVRFNPETGAASGTIVVDAPSAETGNSSRDRTMHGKVLESDRYPEITFAVDRFEGRLVPEGESNLQVHGALTLDGSQHEMAADVSLATAGGQATVTTHFTVPYQAWGLKNPSTVFLRVSEKVNVEMHAVGNLTRTAP